jgi:hypothetical protein
VTRGAQRDGHHGITPLRGKFEEHLAIDRARDESIRSAEGLDPICSRKLRVEPAFRRPILQHGRVDQRVRETALTQQ